MKRACFSCASPQTIVAIEWWAAEITALMAGRVSDDVSTNKDGLSAMALGATIEMPCNMILGSIFSAISTRVSNELGAGRSIGAKRAAVCGMMISLTAALLLSSSLLIFKESISAAFTSEKRIIILVESLMLPTSLYMFFAAICCSFEGIALGSGRQTSGAFFVIIAYFVIGLPVSWLFGMHYGLGVYGLTIGRVIGKSIQSSLYGYLCLRTDWDEQVKRASKQHNSQKKED